MGIESAYVDPDYVDSQLTHAHNEGGYVRSRFDPRPLRIMCVIFTSFVILIAISIALFLVIGVPTIVVKNDKRAQLEKVEDITNSTVLQVDRFRRYGIAVTLNGQVCTMKPRTTVVCINDFHQGVAVRHDTIRNPPSEIGNSNLYMILSNKGIAYVIIQGRYKKPKSSYIFNTWTSDELLRSGPIEYYQRASITSEGNLITKGDPVYRKEYEIIRDE